jgi:hypothetical protein
LRNSRINKPTKCLAIISKPPSGIYSVIGYILLSIYRVSLWGGVIKDYHYQSLSQEISPQAFTIKGEDGYGMA